MSPLFSSSRQGHPTELASHLPASCTLPRPIRGKSWGVDPAAGDQGTNSQLHYTQTSRDTVQEGCGETLAAAGSLPVHGETRTLQPQGETRDAHQSQGTHTLVLINRNPSSSLATRLPHDPRAVLDLCPSQTPRDAIASQDAHVNPGRNPAELS